MKLTSNSVPACLPSGAFAPLAHTWRRRQELPAGRHLIVVPAGSMAGVPVEALTARYLVSYAPSGTVRARLGQKHRPLQASSLLAVGDPNFTFADAGPHPTLPDYGLYIAVVLPGSSAGRARRGGDVLLCYDGVKLASEADLKLAEDGDPVPVVVWHHGKVLDDMRITPGKLGVVISDDPPVVDLRSAATLTCWPTPATAMRSGLWRAHNGGWGAGVDAAAQQNHSAAGLEGERAGVGHAGRVPGS